MEGLLKWGAGVLDNAVYPVMMVNYGRKIIPALRPAYVKRAMFLPSVVVCVHVRVCVYVCVCITVWVNVGLCGSRHDTSEVKQRGCLGFQPSVIHFLI